MFKGIIAIKPFVTMLKMVEAVHHTAVFKATDNGLVCRIKNDNTMLDFVIPKETFIYYDCYDDGDDCRFELKPAEVLRLLEYENAVNNIELYTSHYDMTININYKVTDGTIDFSINGDVDASDIEQIPDFTPVVKLLIKRELLLKALETAGVYDRYFMLIINRDGIEFYQSSNIDDKQRVIKVFYRYGKNISIKEFNCNKVINGHYDVLSLIPILKAVQDCYYVTLYIDKDSNLRLEFLLPFKCNANYYYLHT